MKKKILVLGAGGIVGQHMFLHKPDSIDPFFTKKTSEDYFVGFDADKDDILSLLDFINPDCIVNLCGENRVDTVESAPDHFINVNVELPKKILKWTESNNCDFIQVSTQGVFSGDNAPYSTKDTPDPITHYGRQKFESENIVLNGNATKVMRLTFVLGVRPFQKWGRKNPLEDMIEKKNQLQVNDRFFSPLFAHDAAKILWEYAINFKEYDAKVLHLGNSNKCSRYSIASDLNYFTHGVLKNSIIPVSHEYFTGIAPRPKDTTWKHGNSLFKETYEEGLITAYLDWSKIYNEH